MLRESRLHKSKSIAGAIEGESTVDAAGASGSEAPADDPPSWRQLGFVLIDPNFWLLNVTREFKVEPLPEEVQI